MKFIIGAMLGLVLAGCAGGFKERQLVRERVAQSSGLFCEFVSGSEFPDVDVEVNLRMAKKCDSDKNFSVTQYQNSSNQYGLVYCCAIDKSKATSSPAPRTQKSSKPSGE